MEEIPIKIAIVDDHTLFRNGIATLMNEFPEIEVIFEAGNGQQLQQLIKNRATPDIILMDINMPVLDGYHTTLWLKEHYPLVKVLALSMFEEDKAVLQMIRSGACGYILKEASPLELLDAIKTIALKGVYINDLVTGKLMRSVKNNVQEQRLTTKEIDFLKLCCSELTYKEIAEKLFVSPRTVDNYRESLFQKLHLKSRSGLILFAIGQDIFKI